MSVHTHMTNESSIHAFLRTLHTCLHAPTYWKVEHVVFGEFEWQHFVLVLIIRYFEIWAWHFTI